MVGIFRVSVSEPHTSELNGRLSLYRTSYIVPYIFDAVI